MIGDRGSGPVEHHIGVTRTARYWTLGELPREGGEVWFVLHGYKQLARRFIGRFEWIVSPGRMIVAPEALSRFYVSPEPGRHGPTSLVGATWMTREDRLNEIRDYVAYLDRLAEEIGTLGRKVVVLGFSQGVATATRWAVQGTIRPDRLLLWGDVTPPDLDTSKAGAALATVDVVLVRGDQDRAFSPKLVEEEEARLAAAGITYSLVIYAGGHEIEAAPLKELAASRG